ncbi:MAG: hypothetical protein KKC21_00335 [Nitrospinae bacterium]|nr:hypothetical protein [Nitrospinota bacterium]
MVDLLKFCSDPTPCLYAAPRGDGHGHRISKFIPQVDGSGVYSAEIGKGGRVSRLG